MLLFLIGFMGSGKTSLGKYAARHAGIEFMDLDLLIEAQTGMTIPEIFGQKGEAWFREKEHEVLKDVCTLKGNYLIACGGGTPCFFDNMNLMNSAGITIYLDISSARLTDRLRSNKEGRPMLAQIKGDLQIHIHKMLLERTKFYGKAKVIVPEPQTNKKDLLQLISAGLKNGF